VGRAFVGGVARGLLDGRGWIAWVLAEVALLAGITLVRVALDGRGD
jgi:hypothetical protein